MPKRNILLTEFTVQVYTNGKVDWGGVDEFVLWLIRRKYKAGFLSDVAKIAKFGSLPNLKKRPR